MGPDHAVRVMASTTSVMDSIAVSSAEALSDGPDHRDGQPF